MFLSKGFKRRKEAPDVAKLRVSKKVLSKFGAD